LVQDSSLQATEYLARIKREADEAQALRRALEEERSAVAEEFASLEKDAQKREQQRQASFQSVVDKIVADSEQRARELVDAIQDRSERQKVEREAQQRVAELKREAQRAMSVSTSKTGVVSNERGVRVIRDGRTVEKRSTNVEDEAEPDRYVKAQDREIAVGDKVRLTSFGSIGIVDRIKDGAAEVRVKSLRFREKLEDLELLEEVTPPKTESGRFSKLRPTPKTEVHLKTGNETTRSELNVIGQTTDEAVDAVDKFLDEAFLNSLSEIRIVHGHGTGALRRAITELLKEHPHVERFLQAPPNQGGAGATVVELKT
jgi:DNA mismatch repair protein MutS2